MTNIVLTKVIEKLDILSQWADMYDRDLSTAIKTTEKQLKEELEV